MCGYEVERGGLALVTWLGMGGGWVQKKAEASWERWWVFGEEGWGVEVVLVGKEGWRG